MTNCLVNKGDFPIEISWTLNDRPTSNIIGLTITNANKRSSQLNIESVQANHAGEYVCIAKNFAGIAKYSAHLHVNGI